MMKYKSKSKTPQFFLLLLLVCLMLQTSCTQKDKAPNNELLKKVNAVHQQMMKQGNISEEEKQAILSLASLVSNDDGFGENISKGIPLEEVAHAPVYKGCEALPEEALRACFKESIVQFIRSELNPEIINGLGTAAAKSVEVFFQIDIDGEVSMIKVRDAPVSIQAEILRVLRKLPRMEPASQEGENVASLHSISVPFGQK